VCRKMNLIGGVKDPLRPATGVDIIFDKRWYGDHERSIIIGHIRFVRRGVNSCTSVI
jgi:hypothetical protein